MVKTAKKAVQQVEKAVKKHPPVDRRGNPFNVYYATQIKVRPPTWASVSCVPVPIA